MECKGVDTSHPRKCKSVIDHQKLVHKVCKMAWEDKICFSVDFEINLNSSNDCSLHSFCHEHHLQFENVIHLVRKDLSEINGADD